jgi:drug/metabolite transporter (DMT)-like permease
MPAGLIFAILCLLFAGANDVVFKRYAAKERSRGIYLCGIGVVWLGLQLLVGGHSALAACVTPANVTAGLTAGLLLAASNLLLLESLTRVEVSLGSTIYRLNTIAVVILAFLFLGEPFGLLKGLGVAAGIGAALLLYQHDKSKMRDEDPPRSKPVRVFFLLAVSASLLRALYGVVSKAALSAGASLDALMLFSAACWIVAGAGYSIIVEKRLEITWKKTLYVLTSGVLVFLIANSLMRAIELAEASLVIPISNLGFIVALLIGIAGGLEKLTTRKALAVAASACSVLVLSMVG